ncbi:keratinocyte-associated protein 3 [Podarcis raffonei]|uniref:keratinocyte-associated protein 3 n=1 Tax=Podarcis raffonei TaxID=65483 RepID=UPI0023291939|nr:keratinocyte-associated protein 3 [Podarcis raffonei]
MNGRAEPRSAFGLAAAAGLAPPRASRAATCPSDGTSTLTGGRVLGGPRSGVRVRSQERAGRGARWPAGRAAARVRSADSPGRASGPSASTGGARGPLRAGRDEASHLSIPLRKRAWRAPVKLERRRKGFPRPSKLAPWPGWQQPELSRTWRAKGPAHLREEPEAQRGGASRVSPGLSEKRDGRAPLRVVAGARGSHAAQGDSDPELRPPLRSSSSSRLFLPPPIPSADAGPRARRLVRSGISLVVLGHLNLVLGAIVHGSVLRHVARPARTITSEYAVANVIAVVSGLLSIAAGVVAILVSRSRSPPWLRWVLLAAALVNALVSGACCNRSALATDARTVRTDECPFDTTRIFDTALALWLPSLVMAAVEAGLSAWCCVASFSLSGQGPSSYKVALLQEAAPGKEAAEESSGRDPHHQLLVDMQEEECSL